MCGFLVTGLETKHFEESFKTITHRGPDDHAIVDFKKGRFGFHRLAIMDLSHSGNQPFKIDQDLLVCNGEIYNYLSLKEDCGDYSFHSSSDCEVLLPLYKRFGLRKMCEMLDAEFALVLWDEQKEKLMAARDPMGIRPLFYGFDQSGQILFASEAKALHKLSSTVKPFPPGYFYDGSEFHCYLDLTNDSGVRHTDTHEIERGIRHFLTSAVEKRLQSDAEVGFLLSGGLDSSLVCAIAQKLSRKPIRTFSIGMPHDAIDSKYAEIVAKFIGAEHTSVVMTWEEIQAALREVIYKLETWDITTIRASLGMYLVCKYIKKNTKIKVLLTGEVSDELFGYKYTDFAPTAEAFQEEAKKRIREIYLYDVLRADRSISAHSLEARVPFSDKDFVKFVMHIDPKLKMNTTGTGKFLLRKAFKEEGLLPDSILWREKAAFSDAVGHSMVDYLKELAEKTYTDQEFTEKVKTYSHCAPFTKESLLYRSIFEELFPNREELIPDYWMPNKTWQNCNVTDPSARVLPNYGASGK